MRSFLLCLLFLAIPAWASPSFGDPFEAPPEMQSYVRKVTMRHNSASAKAEGLLRTIFLPVEDGGLGMVYDNSYTRSVTEVWQERKANCLSLTAFFVASCKSIGIDVHFAESPSVSQWRRVGPIIRHELHMVAVIRQMPSQDLVADFLPEMKKGFYLLSALSESRAKALYYSNRAVELLEAGDLPSAKQVVNLALDQDRTCGAAWNIFGVVCQAQGDNALAERAFLSALKVNPMDGAALGNLETHYRAVGDTSKSLECRRLSLAVRAHDPYFQAFLAQEAMNEGDLKKAMKYLELAIHMQEREPDFYLLLSQVHQLMGNPDDAVAVLNKGQKASGVGGAVFQSKMAKIKAAA
jgi:Flp pilus assembly protein TadD